MTQIAPSSTPEGALLRTARERMRPRPTARDIAEKAGVGYVMYGYYERGHYPGGRGICHPPARPLADCCHVLGITPDELLETARPGSGDHCEEAALWLAEMTADTTPARVYPLPRRDVEVVESDFPGVPPEDRPVLRMFKAKIAGKIELARDLHPKARHLQGAWIFGGGTVYAEKWDILVRMGLDLLPEAGWPLEMMAESMAVVQVYGEPAQQAADPRAAV